MNNEPKVGLSNTSKELFLALIFRIHGVEWIFGDIKNEFEIDSLRRENV